MAKEDASDQDDELDEEEEDSDESEEDDSKDDSEEDDKGEDDDAGDEDDKEDKDGEEDEEEVVPVRRSHAINNQNIIARQKRTIEKLRSEDKDDDKGGVAAEVARQLDPVRKTLASAEDERELSDLFKSAPKAKVYETQIRKRMANPAFAAVPISSIYRDLAFDKDSPNSEKRRRAADHESKGSRAGGSQRRGGGSDSKIPELDDMDNMSDAKFEEIRAGALQGKYLEKK